MSGKIRDIGILTWSDPLAWMERMTGSAWKTAIQSENDRWGKALQAAGGVPKKVIHQFQESSEDHTMKDVFQCESILVTPNGTNSCLWRWSDSKDLHEAAAVYSKDSYVWAVEPDTGGKEIYTLVCYEKGKKSPLWKHDTSIGPFVLVKDEYCYIIEATSELRYGTLISLRAETGTGRRILYKEADLRHNCALVAGEKGCVFLLSENSGRHKLFHVKGVLIEQIHPSSEVLFPVGYGSTQTPCYFAKEKDVWKAFGKELTAFQIPAKLFENSSIVFCSMSSQLLVTSSEGSCSFYELRHSVRPKLLYRQIGNCVFNEYLFYKGSRSLNFYISSPGAYPALFFREGFGKLASSPIQTYARSSHHRTSKNVPYILVLPQITAKKLMVIVYGGYGFSTKLTTARWKPYLDCGWALAFALVRGGGDRDEAWADAGRSYLKYNSIYDTEDVIRSAQQKLHLNWKDTCIYGRSAGGYNVGSIVARHGNGGLIASAYAEVPYLDILRTTTNTTLPLTVLEYDEFGNPAERIEDLSTIVRFSPVDSLSEKGAPGLFILGRTSLNDREVFPYESLKWLTRLRGFPTAVKESLPKLLAITGGAGHFVRGSTAHSQMAEDFILLSSFFQTQCAKKSHH